MRISDFIGRALRRDETGSATVEFVIIFPVIMTIFLMSIEIGVMMTRGMMLDRGIDITMRDLRLGNMTPMTYDQLKKEICRNSLIIPECETSISLELRPTPASGFVPTSNRPQCTDKSEEVKPVLEFTPGTSNELMLVSACATFDPVFPTTGLAATIKLDGANEYALVATSAYVNEP